MAGVKTEIQLALTNKKLDQLETDYEQQSSKLTTTIEKLEETANAAAECDRYASKHLFGTYQWNFKYLSRSIVSCF